MKVVTVNRQNVCVNVKIVASQELLFLKIFLFIYSQRIKINLVQLLSKNRTVNLRSHAGQY